MSGARLGRCRGPMVPTLGTTGTLTETRSSGLTVFSSSISSAQVLDRVEVVVVRRRDQVGSPVFAFRAEATFSETFLPGR